MPHSPPKIYGLVGYPVKHSLSPAMHNAAFAHLKIDAGYKLFSLEEPELEDFFRNLTKNNIFGLNVTVPYKERVIPFLDSVFEEAKLIGAVNTVKVSAGKLEGFNTDGEGFFKHITEDLNFNPKGKTIAILGAGGAAKAVSVYLSKPKPKVISIYDIDRIKLSALAGHLKSHFKEIKINPAGSIDELNIPKCDLLVNATPIGMKETDHCLVEEGLLHRNLLVYDLIYNPVETKLLRLAKEKGAKVSNGLGMLLYQGAAAFEIWTGQRAPVKVMRKALDEALNK